MNSETKAYVAEYKQLIGKTVKLIVHEADDADPCMIGLEFTDGTVAWVQSDPEGNDKGFLAIEGNPDAKK